MAAPQKSSKWGSFLSQAVAGVEARLDNILNEEEEGLANQAVSQAHSAPRSRSASTASNSNNAASSAPSSRPATPARSANDRLQERLARAVAAKNAAAASTPRASIEVPSSAQSPRPSSDGAPPGPAAGDQQSSASTTQESTTQDPVRDSQQSGEEAAPSVPGPELRPASPSSSQPAQLAPITSQHTPRTSLDGSDPTIPLTASGAEAAISAMDLYEQRISHLETQLRDTQAQHQEEIHGHIENVDAIQAKLQYLAREASDAARSAAAAAAPGSLEKKVADKDHQIAQLMEEGQKLSANEQKHRAIIKKLRSQIAVNEKDANENRVWRQKAEAELVQLRARSRDLDRAERSSQDSQRLSSQLKKDLEKAKANLASRDATISDLRTQLRDESGRAQAMAAKATDRQLEESQKKTKDLEDAVAAMKVEKDLLADKGKAQATELKAAADRASQRAAATELELKAEVQTLESKLEALRARAEEASSGAAGDAQAKLLRQIETLQTQYAIASENWQGMEASLTARATSLERERDEAMQRESDIRKRARETNNRAKRQEEELEEARSQLPDAQRDVSAYKTQTESLRKRAEEAEAALAEAKADFERQRLAWKEESAETTESERRTWLEDVPNASLRNQSRPESPLLSPPERTYSGDFLGLQNFPTRLRKASAPSSNGDFGPGERPSSARRPSAQPPSARLPPVPAFPVQSTASPSVASGLDMLASPSTHPIDRDDMYSNEAPASPQNILQDVVSVSTAGAGPSVQLVERMSAAIRRLESEKVAAKEELTRISSQRDEARAEIVALMKEVEIERTKGKKVETLEKEVEDLNSRYQTTLEMLGEKSELVEELKADVGDVKAMYRELVERTIK